MDKPHKKLDVWKLSMELSRRIYHLTAGYPGEEKFGLISQMRRAAVSIPSNLAEGAARSSTASPKQQGIASLDISWRPRPGFLPLPTSRSHDLASFASDHSIRTVQELLGHKDVSTTMISTHVLNKGGRGVVSPLDAR